MNMVENITLQRRKKDLEAGVRNFEKRKDISEINKKHVMDFINSMYLENLSAARKMFYLCRFPKMVEFTDNRDLKSLTRKDIENLIIKIERRDYAEWTKHAYKTTIKKFYQFLEGYPKRNIEYPAKVSWIKTYRRLDTKVTASDIMTSEEITLMISKAKNSRDRALISVLYESGCRSGELLNMRMRDLEFHDYGVHVNIDGTKNVYSKRKALLITSLPILTKWINEHPGKDDPLSFLWICFDHRYFGRCMSSNSLANILNDCVKRAGIKGKRSNPHSLRHSRATHLATKLTEAQMCKYFGWKIGSDMPSVYVHLCGKDVDAGILAMHGIVTDDNKKIDFTYKVCPRCSNKNAVDAVLCECGLVLDEKFAMKYEKQEKQMLTGMSKEMMEEWIKTMKEQIKKELLEEKGLLLKAEEYKLI